MKKISKSSALEMLVSNYDGLAKEMAKAKFSRIIDTLKTSATLREASQKLNMPYPTFLSAIQPLRILRLLKIKRGRNNITIELMID